MSIDTTVVYEGVPFGLTYETAAVFVELMAGRHSFNYLYMPYDSVTFVPERLLIVNFVSHAAAVVAIEQASHLLRISVSWYHTQGLVNNINLFRQSCTRETPAELCPRVYDSFDSVLPVLPPSDIHAASAVEKRRGAISTVKVFVGGLQIATDTRSLRKYFSQFGRIEDCAVVRDFAGLSRKFGFCKFVTSEAAKKCLAREQHEIDGCIAGVRAYTNQE